MKKLCAVLAVVFSLVLIFGTVSFAQDVPAQAVKDWLLDVSGPTPDGGAVEGVGVITINDDGTFDGYGGVIEKSREGGNLITLTGTIAVTDQKKGTVTGTITVTDSETDQILLGPDVVLTGRLDMRKFNKLTLKFGTGPGASGIPMPADPVIPSDWTMSGNSPGGKFTGEITIEKDSNYPYRAYSYFGDGDVYNRKEDSHEFFTVEGFFFVNSKGKAFGYLSNGDGKEGSLWGSISTKSFSFSHLSKSEEGQAGDKISIKGKPAPLQ